MLTFGLNRHVRACTTTSTEVHVNRSTYTYIRIHTTPKTKTSQCWFFVCVCFFNSFLILGAGTQDLMNIRHMFTVVMSHAPSLLLKHPGFDFHTLQMTKNINVCFTNPGKGAIGRPITHTLFI